MRIIKVILSMTSDITYSSLVERCSRARYCTSKKRHALSRDRARWFTCSTLVRPEYSNSLLKLCHRLFPSLTLLCPPVVSQVDNRRAPITGWARYINVLLYRALEIPNSSRRVSRYFPPRFFPLGFVPFFRSRPKLNTLESERLNLSAITRSFPLVIH